MWCSSNEGDCLEALEGSGNKDCSTSLGISSKCLTENEGSLSLLWTLRVVDSVGERGNRGVVECRTTSREDWAFSWVPGGPVVLGPLGSWLLK